MPAVYLLHCADDSYYVGSTWQLDARVAQHASGFGGEYTSARLPVALVWFHECDRVDEAWGLERRIHGWSRVKKKALIAGEFERLPGLSKKRRRPSPPAE